jgi:flagellar hook-length control protein FliK
MSQNLPISAPAAQAPAAAASAPAAPSDGSAGSGGALPKFVELLLACVGDPAPHESELPEAPAEPECEETAGETGENADAVDLDPGSAVPALPAAAAEALAAAVPAARLVARESAARELAGAEALVDLERPARGRSDSAPAARARDTGAAAEHREASVALAATPHAEVSRGTELEGREDGAGAPQLDPSAARDELARADAAAHARTPADHAANPDGAANAGAGLAPHPASAPRVAAGLAAHGQRLIPELPGHNESEILRTAQLLHRQGGGEARIELVPPQLGELEVRLVVSAETVHLSLRADQAPVADLLTRHLPELRSALEASGLTLDRVDVDFGAPGDQRGAADAQAQRGDAEARRGDERRATTAEAVGLALGRRAGGRLAASLGAVDAWA